MLLIAGLGNPGAQYAKNRHNVGYMAADAIARRHSFSPWSRKFRGEIAEGTIGGEKVLLIKPSTFMNLSGESVGEAMRFYKLGPNDIVVIHDELDLAAGKIRLKAGGGHGGHNGLRSIDAHIGKDYRRMRIGIGHPGDKARVHNHVLGDFAKADAEWLDPLLSAIADHADLLAGDAGADSTFMNRIALATGSVAPKPGKPPKADAGAGGDKPAAAGKSHIRQARNNAQPKILPTSGPMADMLKRMFGKKDG
ncbi:peptidyl-tRNA hydrolase [Hoeflea marina]|uniref:Peptidyl-tRNA hydrolase n=1 Tax=Hoeflea marina TaxID=274592 RepID=A0A317PJ16_9HYPH|nr:aminoacyl-tRNA hydrolase [Hoeflea marina]PWV97597.1 peptidyl-tRNA hydrolase [Hoeflea marina]